MSETTPRTMWIDGMLLDLDRLEQMAAPAWTPRVAAALFERIRLTEALVRDLAAKGDLSRDSLHCAWCGSAEEHLPTCTYRRAVEATKP